MILSSHCNYVIKGVIKGGSLVGLKVPGGIKGQKTLGGSLMELKVTNNQWG